MRRINMPLLALAALMLAGPAAAQQPAAEPQPETRSHTQRGELTSGRGRLRRCRVPRMLRVHWPAVDVRTYCVASRFLTLDKTVVVILAGALMVLRISEQLPVALVRLLVVDHGRAPDLACLLAALA